MCDFSQGILSPSTLVFRAKQFKIAKRFCLQHRLHIQQRYQHRQHIQAAQGQGEDQEVGKALLGTPGKEEEIVGARDYSHFHRRPQLRNWGPQPPPGPRELRSLVHIARAELCALDTTAP